MQGWRIYQQMEPVINNSSIVSHLIRVSHFLSSLNLAGGTKNDPARREISTNFVPFFFL